MTRRRFPPTRGRTHHRSSSSVSNTQASNVQPPNDPIPSHFPVTLTLPALSPADVATLRRKFPDTFGETETIELPSHARPSAPPDGLRYALIGPVTFLRLTYIFPSFTTLFQHAGRDTWQRHRDTAHPRRPTANPAPDFAPRVRVCLPNTHHRVPA